MNWKLITDISEVIAGSDQVLLLYDANHSPDACYLPYSTSNPDYVAVGNAEKFGTATHWCFVEKVV